jgi:prepilin-type N-terminal cleavage/methylation domain-containing protein
VRARQTGITLIESLVVMAIITILLGMAVPSFQWLRETAAQKRVIHQLHAAVLTARHRSVMMGNVTHLCPSPLSLVTDMSQGPECGDDYGNGVAIWSEVEGDWQLLRRWQWPHARITLRSGNQAVTAQVTFNARGLANRNITWSTCANGSNLSLVLNRVGRPVIRTGWGKC